MHKSDQYHDTNRSCARAHSALQILILARMALHKLQSTLVRLECQNIMISAKHYEIFKI